MSQETMELINTIIQVCILPLLGVLTAYFVKLIRRRAEEIESETDNNLVKKYVGLAEKLVEDAVKSTNQTFVEAMKQQNIFDEAAQKKAFQMTKTAVLSSLNENAKELLKFVFGDFNAWLDMTIEKTVGEQKNLIWKAA